MVDTNSTPGRLIAKTILTFVSFLDIFYFHQEIRVKYTVRQLIFVSL